VLMMRWHRIVPEDPSPICPGLETSTEVLAT
jgi:hypothetical protein